MSLYLKIAAISTLLIFSAVGQSGKFKSPQDNGKITVKPYNKSPCLEEDVYGCQVSGGRFDWNHCMCFYN